MEAAKSYQLLKKMLPESIIHRLNAGQSLIADSHPEVRAARVLLRRSCFVVSV